MRRGEVMGAPVPIRDDMAAEELRRLARQESDGRVACRLLGVANVWDGMSRERAARQAGPSRRAGSQGDLRWSPGAPTDAGVALVLPSVSAAAMQAMLDELSAAVTPGAHAVVLMDRAGWHIAKDLAAPANLTPLFLPPYSPELNAIEQVWLLSARALPLAPSLAPATTTSSRPAAPLGTRCSPRPAASAPSAPSTRPQRSVLEREHRSQLTPRQSTTDASRSSGSPVAGPRIARPDQISPAARPATTHARESRRGPHPQDRDLLSFGAAQMFVLCQGNISIAGFPTRALPRTGMLLP
jgi:hypothetical protein